MYIKPYTNAYTFYGTGVDLVLISESFGRKYLNIYTTEYDDSLSLANKLLEICLLSFPLREIVYD